MRDLISKETLINEIVNTPTNSDGYNPVYLSGSATRQLEILDIINELPTVSEQEIRSKVIDEFADKLKPRIFTKIRGWTNFDDLIRWCGNTIDEIAGQMKEAEGKKPITYSDTNRADCPTCGATVRGISKPFGKYCSHCGQKLNWGE